MRIAKNILFAITVIFVFIISIFGTHNDGMFFIYMFYFLAGIMIGLTFFLNLIS